MQYPHITPRPAARPGTHLRHTARHRMKKDKRIESVNPITLSILYYLYVINRFSAEPRRYSAICATNCFPNSRHSSIIF